MPLVRLMVAAVRVDPRGTAGVLPPVRVMVSVLNCRKPGVKITVSRLPLVPPTINVEAPVPDNVPLPVIVPFNVNVLEPIAKAQDEDKVVTASTNTLPERLTPAVLLMVRLLAPVRPVPVTWLVVPEYV